MVELRCLSSNKAKKFMDKYQDLKNKILAEIDNRITYQLKIISLILKRSKKLSQEKKLKMDKEGYKLNIDELEMYQVMKM